MRLVEVVMLMGAHCVSPVEHGQLMTDAAKVQCAVVIERDTEAGSVTVTPPDAVRDPQVAAAVQRFAAAPVDVLSGSSTRIVPAWAPAGSPPTEVKLPIAQATIAAPPQVPGPAALASSDIDSPPTTQEAPAEPAEKVATLVPPPPKRTPARIAEAPKKRTVAKVQPATAKRAAQCMPGAVARWYKTDDGKRKYRCVKPQDRAPAQLY